MIDNGGPAAPTFPRGPVVLCILDGLGLGEPSDCNALFAARTPNLCEVDRAYIGTRLAAAGRAVGLAPGQMGNSNVGHIHIGSGCLMPQDGPRIDAAIADGTFFERPALIELMDGVRSRGGTLHILGLVSDGGVHSALNHLRALLTMARRRAVGRVAVHAFLDGRDVSPGTAPGYLEEVARELDRSPGHRLATVAGRYYAMDRDRRWERLELALAAILRGEGRVAGGIIEAVEAWEAAEETDEFVTPTVLGGYSGVEPADGFLAFNFRADRMRQMVRALLFPDRIPVNVEPLDGAPPVVTMTRYDREFPVPVVFEPVRTSMGLGEAVSVAGVSQLRIAETEKYAHVTYFFNGGRESPFAGEDRILVPSPPVATYDREPRMSARAVTEHLLEALYAAEHPLIVVNYANPDMVGHTGDFDAAVAAVESVDRAVGRLVETIEGIGGVALITSDHGNVEKMANDSGCHTAHTVNDVPCFLVGPGFTRGGKWGLRRGGLIDVAPTVLGLLGLEVPETMSGTSLLVHAKADTVTRGEILDGCRQ